MDSCDRRTDSSATKNPRLAPWRGGTSRGAHAVLLTVALLLGACDRTPTPPPTPRQLIVFATLYPLADIARQVGGDRVRADWLVDLGDPIDTFTLSDADRARMAGVDLILADGAGRTEVWAQRELDRRRETGSVASVDETPDAWRSPADGLLVLDPVLAGEYAQYVAKLLTRRQPTQGEQFRTRAAAFATAVNAATAAFTAPPDARVVVLSSLFQPLLARVNVRPVVVPADALHFTPADADAVRRAAAEADAASLVVPFDTPPATRAYLETATGLKVFALDALGYPNFEQHGTYLDLLKYNLEQLRLATAS